MRQVPKPLNPEEVYLFAIVERLDALISILSGDVKEVEPVEVKPKPTTRTRKTVKKE